MGTPEEPIVFTGESASRGFWRGIYFRNVDAKNELRHVVVEYGGSHWQTGAAQSVANVYVHGGRLAIRDATLRESGGYGISVEPGSTVDGCAALVLEDNELGPSYGMCPTP